jgi:ferredoxin-nitrate reductase
MHLAYAMEDRGDRLRYPELRRRRTDPLERVSWQEAMRHAAGVLRATIECHGPDSVGFYVSGQCLTEEYYLANKLVKGFLGTNNIDTNSRLCMSSAVAAYTRTFGEDIVPVCYDDIELADCVLIAGANPAWCHPILFRRLEAHKAANPHVKVIVADPRRTESCGVADLHLALQPGTDIVLFHAIARVLIERGFVDRRFIAERTEGYAEYERSVLALGLNEAAARCGIPVEDVVRAAEYIGGARAFLSMWAMGLNQSAIGVEKNLALMALHLVTGQIGRPGSGPFSLTGQPNAMGGREVGGMATLLAAHRELENPLHRQEVADFWGVPSISEKPGLTATEMFDAMADGRLRAVWIIATNPIVSLPDSSRAERALARAQFVVVQDISRHAETLRFADLVLPAAGHFEKDGTMTNSERRIGYLEKVVDPPGEALPDTEILVRFAQAMGFHGFDYGSTAEIFDEWARLTVGTHIDISGLSHDLLRRHGPVQWPYPAARSREADRPGSGTARLFTDWRFFTESGRARLHAVAAEAWRSAPRTPEYPLVLTTGRVRDQWHTMTKTGKVRRLRQHVGRALVSIHPHDADVRGIGDAEPVVIRSPRGTARALAHVTREVPSGLVFMPMHWCDDDGSSATRANDLTQSLVDPVSKEPDFKYTPVQVARVTKPRERIVVVGAGAAAFRFVERYRELDRVDEIHVFSGEPYPFYDRVRLPEYVSDRVAWTDLLKLGPREVKRLDLHLHPGTRITRIDRERQLVTDERGGEHRYDRLVVATGSRPSVPAGAPSGPGVHTMRTRRDADALKASLQAGTSALVVGGGLLGVELAAAFVEVGVAVSIVERAGRLMERQLDAVASELLQEVLQEMGIAVYLADQVHHLARSENALSRPLRAELRSGAVVACDAVVLALGTHPNVELLAEAGLECARGVRVDDRMRTSDPKIYAIGEIAEHRGVLHGITAAAEEQAEVAAAHIAGDDLATYRGSVRMNVLKLAGLDLCSIGIPDVPRAASGYEEIVLLDRARRLYKKCIVRDDRLVGAILLGDKAEAADFRRLVGEGLELGDRRDTLLRAAGAPSAPPLGRIVCPCGNVGEGNVARSIEAGCDRLEDVCRATGAGLACGSCKPAVRLLLQTLRVHAS